MKIISHRGASGYAPENTLKAFKLALKMEAENFEFDIQMTKDRVLIVHHDFDLLRTAGVKAKISDLTFRELKKVNIAKHFAGAGFHSVPTLSDTIRLIKRKAALINIEIKNDGGIYCGIEKETLKIAENEKITDKALLSSFYYPSALKLRQLSDEVRLAYLRRGLTGLLLNSALKNAKKIKAESFHINKKLVFKKNVKKIREAGMKVYAYTVNSKEDLMKAKEAGIDGIFTNYPDIMEKLWKQKNWKMK